MLSLPMPIIAITIIAATPTPMFTPTPHPMICTLHRTTQLPETLSPHTINGDQALHMLVAMATTMELLEIAPMTTLQVAHTPTPHPMVHTPTITIRHPQDHMSQQRPLQLTATPTAMTTATPTATPTTTAMTTAMTTATPTIAITTEQEDICANS